MLRCSLAHLHTRWKLPYALSKSLKGPLLSPILPRLFLILFTYLQPIFIGVAIKFVNGTSDTILGTNSGLRLLLFATTVYIGIAVQYPKVICLFHQSDPRLFRYRRQSTKVGSTGYA